MTPESQTSSGVIIPEMGLEAFACATLLLALADSASWSDWKYVPLERKSGAGMWSPTHSNAKDFQDTRFQYRWKSERIIDTYVCNIEVRPTGDIDEQNTIPELNILYYDPSSLTAGYLRILTSHQVSIGKAAHAIFKPSGCRRVDFVSWHK